MRETLQDAEPLRRHHRRHQREDANRRSFHDNDGDLHHRFRRPVKPFCDGLGDLAGHQDPDTEHDGEEDDLQDVARGQCFDRIGWHNIQQAVDYTTSLRRAFGNRLHAAGIGIGECVRCQAGAGAENRRHDQAQGHRDCGRPEIGCQRPYT